MEEAEQVLQQAEALAPMPGSRSLRAAMAGKVGDADQALKLYLELARSEGMDSGYASSAAMSSLYSDTQSAQQVADLHRSLFAAWGDGARTLESFVRAPLDGRRVKLGIVSADFHHQHPVNIFMQPVLRELDTSKFELFMYFVGDSHDEQTALARSRTEHWVEVGALNTTQLAKRIDADEIDVLLDMAGHTNQHRMKLFAQRAAPVQMTYLGYPGSTGVPNIDFILGDDIVTPEGCESLYTEQVLRLPGTVFCFAPEEDYAFPKFKATDTKRTLTFGSFNNVPKLTPRTLQLWARVLAAVPDSRLVLKAPSFSDEAAKRIFCERLQTLGVDLSRVEFRGPVGLTDMMAEYADIDIALDPVPYNGGTTSLQAMWMGVPVLTQMGAHFVSRMGASFMTAAGLPEWVAKDDDDYVAIAKSMASDRKALLALRKGLRKRLHASPAWDVKVHTRAFERALLTR
jgi:predicted O-linked N-acetylglucosamine transferase (SPINDLY family)